MLWAITSYFNPCGYRNRLATYRMFREHLQVPLIAVELGFDGRFELTPADADQLIQLHDGDVMFQKERLLGVAMQSLPDECTAVAWLDCDVIFADPNWGENALRKLQSADIIQPFANLYRLQQGDPVDFPASRRSIPPMISLIKQWKTKGVDLDYWATTDGSKVNFRPGIAWAARRDLLERVELYDVCIVGSGDKAFCGGLFQIPELAYRYLAMSPAFGDHYRDWLERFSKVLPLQTDFVETELIQLWHGDYANRRYKLRHLELSRLGYDPHRDLRLGTDGAWKWTNPDSEMATYVKNYFLSRREDG